MWRDLGEAPAAAPTPTQQGYGMADLYKLVTHGGRELGREETAAAIATEIKFAIQQAVEGERESIAKWHEKRAEEAEKAARTYYTEGVVVSQSAAYVSAIAHDAAHSESARAIREGRAVPKVALTQTTKEKP